jgi:hypothetical protein
VRTGGGEGVSGTAGEASHPATRTAPEAPQRPRRGRPAPLDAYEVWGAPLDAARGERRRLMEGRSGGGGRSSMSACVQRCECGRPREGGGVLACVRREMTRDERREMREKRREKRDER